MANLHKINETLQKIQEDEASDLYHDNVKSGKDYNDYKGIQIHNLRKELKQIRKILLNLQDIEGKDNSSDMVNNIKGMLGGYEQVVDNMESAFNKLEIGRHRKESVREEEVDCPCCGGPCTCSPECPNCDCNAVDENIDEGEALDTPEEWRSADAANMQHAKVKLEKLIRELDVDILWRGHNSAKFFNNGDRAGTGQLEGIVDKLRDINKDWDTTTSLYGM
jgi:hypothetical protein